MAKQGKRQMTDAIERSAAHIGRAFQNLHTATIAVDLPVEQLRDRMSLAIAELTDATKELQTALT